MSHFLPESWHRSDILADYGDRIRLPELQRLREERWSRLLRPHWEDARRLLGSIPLREQLEARGSYEIDTDAAAIRFGDADTLRSPELEALEQLLRRLIPWRKGPFSVCGIEIDAEWQSNRKWDRVLAALPDLENKLVADIGCSNGYYMMRALSKRPWAIMGIDPSEKFLFAFELFQRLGHFPQLQYELLGIEEMGLFDGLFDVVFCFGILYHHRDPLALLRTLWAAVKPGGYLLVETQAIPGEQPIALCPPDRYAKARNIYFVPTAACVESWLIKAGFRSIEHVSTEPVTVEEQRTTAWMPFESLSDFLDPEDSSKTLEGFAAPLRTIHRARRPR